MTLKKRHPAGPAPVARIMVVAALFLAATMLLAVGCEKKITKEEAEQAVVSTLPGAEVDCITLFLIQHGDRRYDPAERLKPSCIRYKDTSFTLKYAQKDETLKELGYRLQVTYVHPGQAARVYRRTYWFDQSQKETAEKEAQALAKLGSTRAQ